MTAWQTCCRRIRVVADAITRLYLRTAKSGLPVFFRSGDSEPSLVLTRMHVMFFLLWLSYSGSSKDLPMSHDNHCRYCLQILIETTNFVIPTPNILDRSHRSLQLSPHYPFKSTFTSIKLSFLFIFSKNVCNISNNKNKNLLSRLTWTQTTYHCSAPGPQPPYDPFGPFPLCFNPPNVPTLLTPHHFSPPTDCYWQQPQTSICQARRSTVKYPCGSKLECARNFHNQDTLLESCMSSILEIVVDNGGGGGEYLTERDTRFDSTAK